MTGGHDNASCELCWALVPRTLMHFHREWHASQDRASGGVVPDLDPTLLRR